MSVYPVYPWWLWMSKEGYLIIWHWNYRRLLAIMWVLALELMSSARATSALNHWAISPVPEFMVFISYRFILLKDSAIKMLFAFLPPVPKKASELNCSRHCLKATRFLEFFFCRDLDNRLCMPGTFGGQNRGIILSSDWDLKYATYKFCWDV